MVLYKSILVNMEKQKNKQSPTQILPQQKKDAISLEKKFEERTVWNIL